VHKNGIRVYPRGGRTNYSGRFILGCDVKRTTVAAGPANGVDALGDF
jgi:hypothetical protein